MRNDNPGEDKQMQRYRYRKDTGVSRDVVSRFKKISPKLGTITRIAGKRFRSTRSWKHDGEVSTWTTTYEVVMVHGTTGTARMDGCCWGYSGGEGPRAVRDLLVVCGVPLTVAEETAFRSKREQCVGTDWEIDLTTLDA